MSPPGGAARPTLDTQGHTLREKPAAMHLPAPLPRSAIDYSRDRSCPIKQHGWLLNDCDFCCHCVTPGQAILTMKSGDLKRSRTAPLRVRCARIRSSRQWSAGPPPRSSGLGHKQTLADLNLMSALPRQSGHRAVVAQRPQWARRRCLRRGPADVAVVPMVHPDHRIECDCADHRGNKCSQTHDEERREQNAHVDTHLHFARRGYHIYLANTGARIFTPPRTRLMAEQNNEIQRPLRGQRTPPCRMDRSGLSR